MSTRAVEVGLSANTSGYVAGMARADAATARLEGSLKRVNARQLSTEQTMHRVGKVGGAVFLTAAAGIAIAEKKAADFNEKMATVRTLSHANSREFELLSKAAKTVGANIGYSATESAAAEEEMIKAGVKLKDIMGGGLKGALDLAAAGQTDVGTATEVAASAMTQFKLAGQDVPHIADLLAAGADKALGSVTDLGYGLSQVGTTAHQMNISIEDTVGTLAEFAQNGLTGERGGTTFKMMLLRLANPTEKAHKLMDKLGLSIYDANGQMKSMPQIAGNLQKAFKGLDPASRNAALGIIFGSRAIQAANILIKEGAAGNRKWIKSVNDQGFAAQQASGKMDSLKGDLQKLDAQLGNALINQGGKQGFLRGLVQDATKLTRKFNELSDAQRNFIGKGIVKVAAAGGLLWTASKVYKLAKDTSALYRGLSSIGGKSVAGGLAGGLAGRAGGTVPVFVTNPGFAGVAGGKGAAGGVAAGVAGSAAGSAAGVGVGKAVAGGVLGTVAGAVIGKAAPNLFKIWAGFQERSTIASALSKASAFSPPAWMVAGGGGMKTIKPGEKRSDGSMLKSPDMLTKEQVATLSKAEKAQLGLNRAVGDAGPAFKIAYDLVGKINPAMGKYASVLNTIPKEIRSYVSTPGAVHSMGEMRRIATQYKLTPKQIRTIMRLQGFSETQGRIIAAGKAYRNLPKKVQTLLRQEGAVKTMADVWRLQKRYNLTPRQVRTLMHVSGVDAAVAQANRITGALNNIPRNVYIKIHQSSNRGASGNVGTGGANKAVADGGQVFAGPGQSKSARADSIYARLSHREFVHSVAAVDYYGEGFMRAVNSRTFPRTGYRDGGQVGVVAERGFSRSAGHSGAGSLRGLRLVGTLDSPWGPVQVKGMIADAIADQNDMDAMAARAGGAS